MNANGLDKVDLQILEQIRDNARMSYSDIGAAIGLSRVAVKNRMDAMEEASVIEGYKTVINSRNATAEGMEFIMDIITVPERYHEVAEALAKKKSIHKLAAGTGRSRLFAWGYAPNYPSLRKFVDEFYYSMKGIQEISFHTILSVLKDSDGGIDYDKNRGKQSETAE